MTRLPVMTIIYNLTAPADIIWKGHDAPWIVIFFFSNSHNKASFWLQNNI